MGDVTRPTPLLALAGLVAAGGAVGTTARALLEHAFAPAPGAWPWTTSWINLAGSFVLGALLETLLRSGPDTGRRRAVRLGCGTGVLGGFTTYSTFVVEVERLADGGHVALGAAYGLGSVVLGVLAALGGIALAAAVRRRATRGGGAR
ncbi:FluC/FEX family fluoride channel [Cellulosimicrobium composti]|uniref:FluC/FEX family fluoride channel n=1 Tax=Cellulosimicrobium composti TaxID=2672572 RepID=UPI000462F765|nr:CrcB family protein [Cellulosimicrobium composti]TWG74780.1 CrcB protein [Cellulosimicrobium cellulans J34]SMF17986.1 camphor resistance protein CrcB [Cellulosimicrobium cellulans J1]